MHGMTVPDWSNAEQADEYIMKELFKTAEGPPGSPESALRAVFVDLDKYGYGDIPHRWSQIMTSYFVKVLYDAQVQVDGELAIMTGVGMLRESLKEGQEKALKRRLGFRLLGSPFPAEATNYAKVIAVAIKSDLLKKLLP